MSKIVDFFKKGQAQSESIDLLKGGKLEVMGRVQEMDILQNKYALPIKTKDLTDDMVNYQKRYQMAQAIDTIMNRIQNDPELNGKKVALIIQPQDLQTEGVDHPIITTTVEIALPMLLELDNDVTVHVCDTKEVVMKVE